MKVEIDIHPTDALAFTRFLNEDEGLREGAVRLLLQQNNPAGIAKITTIVAVLGRISKGFVEALEREKLFDAKTREAELRVLAGLERAAA